MGRQDLAEVLVPGQQVRDMGDVGLAGADLLEEVETLLQRGVGAVLLGLHAAQGDVVETPELLVLGVVDVLDVGQVGDVAEAVAQH